VVLMRRATLARAGMLGVSGVFALIAGALMADDGVTWGDEGILALGSAVGIALVVAGTTGFVRRRVETARPVAPEAVRLRPPRRLRALRAAAPVAFLVAVAVALSAWNDGGFTAGALWVVWALGTLVEVRTVRAAEREHGGRLAAIAVRRPWRERLRHPWPRTTFVLLRPRVDVTIADDPAVDASSAPW
jgi:hypothetical protein